MKKYGREDHERFLKLLSEMEQRPEIQLLEKNPQHKGNTTLRHCRNVALCSYYLAHKLRWEIDMESLARGAMLHDFYLYDTRTMPYSDYRHALVHPKLALKNAEKYFSLNKRERGIILCHMWPIPGAPIPKSREAWLVCMADKYCAVLEMRGKKRDISPRFRDRREGRIRAGRFRTVRR